MRQMGDLTAVDLFCGAGGLSLGLKNAGFKVVAGIEVSLGVSKTYEKNHPDAKLLVKDIREVTGRELFDLIGLNEITLMAGCPPCQGFSTLTNKYHREDPRNDLVLEMARIIEETNPKIVMMENVPGLATRGKAILDKFIQKIESNGYVVNKKVLQLANYGVPQSRRRFVLLAGKGFFVPLPKPTHCKKGDEKCGLKPWITLRSVLKNVEEPITLSRAKENGGPKRFNWHVVRDLKEVTKKRLKILKIGKDRLSLPKCLRPNCHKSSSEGFQNVYGRMTWNQTPPTMTGGCTTFCKGRFGHPKKNRTISVREAALIQTFPKSYEFDTEYMDLACDMVGNALPPKFAKLAAKECIKALCEPRLVPREHLMGLA